jgi:hypothetical protein
MNPDVHKRYLEYLERRNYFGPQAPRLGAKDFTALDAEWYALTRQTDRSDEDEERLAAVGGALFRD